jgi:hypothetical protein
MRIQGPEGQAVTRILASLGSIVLVSGAGTAIAQVPVFATDFESGLPSEFSAAGAAVASVDGCAAANWQGGSDESWAIENVVVTAGPPAVAATPLAWRSPGGA